MSLQTNIKLNDTIVPSIPFLWYREEQLLCPILYITVKDNIPIIVQTHVLENANIYICLHSLMYYALHGNNAGEILEIPQNYVINMIFTVSINEIEPNSIVLTNNSLRLNTLTNGPVMIHDGAFSPPGYPYFKVNLNNEFNKITCNVLCPELNINYNCLFILFNDIYGTNIDDKIKNFIEENL